MMVILMTDLVFKKEALEELRGEFMGRVWAYQNQAENMIIDSIDQWGLADRMVSEGQIIKAGIKERADPVVKEKDKAHSDAVRFRAGLVNPIEKGSQALLAKMQSFKRRYDREQAEIQKSREAELLAEQEKACQEQAKQMEAEGQPSEVIEAVKELGRENFYVPTQVLRSKTGFSIGWDFEIVDEKMVPDLYVVREINKKAIREIIKTKKGNIKIPGIKIFQVEKTKRSRGNQ
jgi:hypothetical protein